MNVSSRASLSSMFVVLFAFVAAYRVDAQILLISNLAGNSAGAGYVGAYSPDGTALNGSLITGLTSPYGLAVAPTGHIWVSDGTNVRKFNANGTSTGISVNLARTILSMGVDSNGNVYVGSITGGGAGDGTVQKISSAGTVLNANFITGLDLPTAIAVSYTDTIFVSHARDNTVNPQNNGSIGAYTTSGGSASFTTANLRNPVSVAVDNSGGLYGSVDMAIAAPNYKISKFSAVDGSTTTSNLISPLTNPVGLTVSGSHLFITDSALDDVLKYTTSGTLVSSDLITSGLSDPHGIAVTTAIPEPSTNAMLAGLSVLALGYWQRSRRQKRPERG
jgi:hypothetical protein